MNRTGQILHSSYAIKKAYDGLWDKIQETYALTRVEIDVLSFLANNPDCDTASCIVEYRKIAKSHVSGAVESLLEVMSDVYDHRRQHSENFRDDYVILPIIYI